MINNFENYVNILLESVGWKYPTDNSLPLEFLNDIDKIAQKYGYSAVAFGEHENDRVIKFRKTKENE